MSCVSLEIFCHKLIGACGGSLLFRHCTADFKGGNDMDFWNAFASLFSNFGNLTWQMVVMWGIGACSSTSPSQKRWSRACFSPWASVPSSSTCPYRALSRRTTPVGPISALFEAGMSNEPVPPAALHRHRCDDRLRPAAREAVADALRRSGAVRHLLHPLPSRASSSI